MSTSAKTGVTLVIILAIIVAGGTWYAKTKDQPVPEITPSPVAAAPSPAPQADPLEGLGLSNAGDNSTAALETDLTAVGAQVENLAKDTKSLDISITQ